VNICAWQISRNVFSNSRGIYLTYYLAKIAVTTVLIVAISEIAKRSSLLGAILASVPLVSVLAMSWLYIDTKDVNKVSELASSVFWLFCHHWHYFLHSRCC